MTDARTTATDTATRRPWSRWRLSTLLGLVAALALVLAWLAHWREARAPWNAAGGMIGWTDRAMIARLGDPAESIEAEYPDTNGRLIRPAPPGPYRTLLFRSFHGRFVAWFHLEKGRYVCFRSHWVEWGTYY